jgi:hypothetical protein
LFPQTNSGEVLAFSLGSQAKPKWPVGRENLRLRLRHSRLISFNPYQEARSFQLQLFSLASNKTGFSQSAGRYLSL